jgi:hypothetical protein
MYCPNCSSEASSEQKFCRSCGLELLQVADLISRQTDIARPATRKETSLDGRRRAMVLWGMILSLGALAAGSSFKILWNENIRIAGDFTPYLLPITLLVLFLGFGLMCYPFLRSMASSAKPGHPLSPKPERATDQTSELTDPLPSELPPIQASVTEQTTKFLEESEARIPMRNTGSVAK